MLSLLPNAGSVCSPYALMEKGAGQQLPCSLFCSVQFLIRAQNAVPETPGYPRVVWMNYEQNTIIHNLLPSLILRLPIAI
jgi:hypothetical protein